MHHPLQTSKGEGSLVPRPILNLKRGPGTHCLRMCEIVLVHTVIFHSKWSHLQVFVSIVAMDAFHKLQ